MKFARVISNKRGTSHICPRDKVSLFLVTQVWTDGYSNHLVCV